MKLNEQQLKAVEMATEMPNCIIAGGAGTGKTTIIKQILAELPRGFAYLAAPTGKAAARMKECTGYFAETIHRLIGITEDGSQFGGTDLSGKAVIVDEASMIDSYLMAKLIEAKPSRLILIGDEAQLPPVGAGSPFHDLLQVIPDSSIRLTQCYRNTASVHHAARMIRDGEFPCDDEAEGEKYTFAELSPELAQQQIVDMYANGDLRPGSDVVLAAIYGEPSRPGGILALNAAIMNVVNPHAPGQKWKEGDRVINCKNFGKVDWWNGDMGTIVDVDCQGKSVEVAPDRNRDEGNIYITETEMLNELKHAWALSVHKSQGSQWQKVVFLAPREHSYMLSRPLIYTAVTRAQKECLVMGSRYTFSKSLEKMAVKNTSLKLIAEREILGL